MVKFLTLNDILRGFTSSYGAGTKFIRNTGLFGMSDVDQSLALCLITYFAKLGKDDTCFQFQYGLCICMESVIVQLQFHQNWLLHDL